MVASRAVAGGGAAATAQCKPGGVCGTDVLREDTHENSNRRVPLCDPGALRMARPGTDAVT